jgi:hypothetical protein
MEYLNLAKVAAVSFYSASLLMTLSAGVGRYKLRIQLTRSSKPPGFSFTLEPIT